MTTDIILQALKNTYTPYWFRFTLYKPNFPSAIEEKGLGQSMSRRGNCWDTVPQESFFGHFKDEANIKECQTLDELKWEVKRYMMYHNTARYQWN